MALQLHSVAASRGLAWVRLAFGLFFGRPFALTSLFGAFLFVMLLALAVPYAGGLLLIAALPLLTLGYMIATRAALAGEPVHAGLLIEPLRRPHEGRRRALLLLCLFYGLATVAIIALSDSVDGGRFDRLQVLFASAEQSPAARVEMEALLADPALLYGMVLRFGLAALLSVPFWHAPALVWWGSQGVAQALFSSTLACWRTKAAFTVYALAWAGVLALFGLVTGALFSLIGGPQLAGIAALPAGLMFTVVFYVSLYFSFDDTFGARSDPAL